MHSTARRLLGLVLCAVAAFVVVSLIRFWVSGRSPMEIWSGKPQHRPESYSLATKAPLELDDVELLSRLNDEYSKLTQAVMPSVVSIDTSGTREELLTDLWGRSLTRQRMTQGQGSGVIVSNEGHVITNAHVISGQSRIQITLHDGKSHPASLIGQDSLLDIAVLKIEAPGSFTPLMLGDSSQVKVGQMVFAIGNPFGLSETVTQGIISAKERSISDQQRDLFQTDAAINPGNSGGPLVNLQGEIIGINVAIFSPDKENPGFQGVGFSIPSNDVKESLTQILEKGRPVHGFLGVKMWPLDARVRQALGYQGEVGCVVRDIVEHSPAAKAGIQPRDIITSYQSKKISSPDQLFALVQRSRIGEEIPIELWRNGKTHTLKATITENVPLDLSREPVADQSTARDPDEIISRYGVLVRSFSGLEMVRGFQGALVTYVSPGGLAADTIQVNDIIVAVNQNDVANAQDFYRQFVASAAVQATQITLIRDSQPRTITIQPLPRNHDK